MSQQISTARRRSFLAAGIAAGAAVMMWNRAAAARADQARRAAGGDDFPFGRTDEHDLDASDASLPARARALIRIGNDGIARENEPAMLAFFHPDFRFHGPGGTELDREKLWDHFARCRAAFDDFTVTRQAIVSDGAEYAASRTRFAGRFVRPFIGSPEGRIEPNGKPFEYRVINIFRYAPDGRLAEEWVQYDAAAFSAQLRRPRSA